MTVIALVEHSDLIRTRLQRGLSAAGFEVVAAQGGAEALRLLVDVPADLAIVDLEVPDLGGPELIRAIRCTYDLAVLALSESWDSSSRSRAFLAGADHAIPKLGDPALLVHAVISWARRQGHEGWADANALGARPAQNVSRAPGVLLQWPGAT